MTLNELVALFCGVENEAGGWETEPWPTPELAYEIARRIEPTSESELRRALFGTRSEEQLTWRTKNAIEHGFKRYRETRESIRTPMPQDASGMIGRKS